MFLYFHDDHFTRVAKTQKTYGRFFGMIFLEESESMLNPSLQRFTTEENKKNCKNTKKSVIFFRADPHFSAKTP
jgi:hypothetical protein